MTTTTLTVVLGVMVIATLLRMYESRKFIELDDATKERLVANMHGVRQTQGFVTIGILAVGLGPMLFGVQWIVLPVVALWVLVIVAGGFGLYSYRRLCNLGAPDSYVKAFGIRNVATVVGVALVAMAVLFPNVFV